MRLRKIEESDRPKIDELIAKDPWHAGEGSADFFFEPFSEGLAIHNSAGDVVYFRISRALRINAVFDPDARESNKEIMTLAAKFFAENARTSGFREVSFTSANPALRKFGKTLGFSEEPTLIMPVDPAVKE
jgi:hypothetical protein